MPRPPRITEAGLAYHLLNRRVMRLAMFEKADDYAGFERVLGESLARADAPRLLAYCLMPNHWHLVVQAGRHTDLSSWMHWVTVTHTRRWHAHFRTVGEGPLYQGRFKSFPVQDDAHVLTVCRYVEANPVRARLVARAQEWRWGSLWVRRSTTAAMNPRLGPWPVERPRNWLAEVNRTLPEKRLHELRRCATRGTPLGGDPWKTRIVARLGLNLTLSPRGRPRKNAEK